MEKAHGTSHPQFIRERSWPDTRGHLMLRNIDNVHRLQSGSRVGGGGAMR